MKPSVRELEHALSIRRQIIALEKRLAAILRGSIAKPKARRRLYENDHDYGFIRKQNKKEGHRKLDRSRVCLCAGGLRKGAFSCPKSVLNAVSKWPKRAISPMKT